MRKIAQALFAPPRAVMPFVNINYGLYQNHQSETVRRVPRGSITGSALIFGRNIRMELLIVKVNTLQSTAYLTGVYNQATLACLQC